MPEVSIIIPTYNRADYLPLAIESVLQQDGVDLELIVVDDGSTDDTPQVVARYAGDPRVRYMWQPNSGWCSAGRNHGAHLAQGKFLGFLDSDDCYMPGTLAAHLETFSHRPELGLALGTYEYIDESGCVLGKREPWAGGCKPELPTWLFDCFGLAGVGLMRRDWFQRAGGFDPSCDMAEDWDLCLRLAYQGCPMDWTRGAVCRYLQHAGGSVREIPRHQKGCVGVLERFFSQPEMPPDLKALEGSAKGWIRVVFARKYYAMGQGPEAAQDLSEALQLDPELGASRRLEVLQFLLTPAIWLANPPDLGAIITAHPPAGLRILPGDLRRARARIEMARFFRENKPGTPDLARPHLYAGLRLDPRWMANRGVLAFVLRQLLDLR